MVGIPNLCHSVILIWLVPCLFHVQSVVMHRNQYAWGMFRHAVTWFITESPVTERSVFDGWRIDRWIFPLLKYYLIEELVAILSIFLSCVERKVKLLFAWNVLLLLYIAWLDKFSFEYLFMFLIRGSTLSDGRGPTLASDWLHTRCRFQGRVSVGFYLHVAVVWSCAHHLRHGPRYCNGVPINFVGEIDV